MAREIGRPLFILIAVVGIGFLLAGCQSVKGDFCQIAHPIRLSQQAIDAMSDEEVKEALAHNRLGARLCRWKP